MIDGGSYDPPFHHPRLQGGMKISKRKHHVLFILPLLIFLSFMIIYSFISALNISLRDAFLGYLNEMPFVGLKNFKQVIMSRDFWHSMEFSLKFATMTTGIESVIGFFIAYFYYLYFRKNRMLLTLLILPMMMAPTLFGLMNRILFNNFIGLIPGYISALFNVDIDFFSNKNIIGTLVLIDTLQWTPFVIIIMFASFVSIPKSLIDAARIDGAGSKSLLFRIILPLVIPSLITASFLRFIESFRVFDTIYVLTGGGPGNLTTSVSIYIYKMGFDMGIQGVASAASLILFLIMLVPTLIAIKLIIRG